MLEDSGQVITVGELIRLAARLIREHYNDSVHGEGICREVLARLIAEASGQDRKEVGQIIGRLAPDPSWPVTMPGYGDRR